MKSIKYLVMDVDGTLTDGKIYMGNNGEIMKAFNIKDGCGIRDLAIPAGIMPIIITGRKSNILEKRCKELGITKIYQGVVDKMEQMKSVIPDLSEMAYIGDDINDLTCMSAVKAGGGVVGCPADAAKEVVDLATFVSVQKGGNGAVREFIEWLLNSTPSFLR